MVTRPRKPPKWEVVCKPQATVSNRSNTVHIATVQRVMRHLLGPHDDGGDTEYCRALQETWRDLFGGTWQEACAAIGCTCEELMSRDR